MKRFILAAALVLAVASQSFAISDINFIPGMGQNEFKRFSQQAGALLSYKPLSPAAPLGITGFDIGIEASAIDVDSGVWSKATGGGSTSSFAAVPKLHAIKGLPGGFDIGAVYSEVPSTNIRYYGGEVKYAILEGSAITPALAVRGTYTQLAGVDVLDFKTYGIEATLSKGIGIPIVAKFTPYIGVGSTRVQSTPKGAAAAPPIGLSKEDFAINKAYVGLQFNFTLIGLTAEYETNSVSAPVTSVKASLVW